MMNSFKKRKAFYRVLTGSFPDFAILVNAALTLHKNYINPENIRKFALLGLFKRFQFVMKRNNILPHTHSLAS